MMQETAKVVDTAPMIWTAEYPSAGSRKDPKRLAIVNNWKTYTYQELDVDSDRFAGYLHDAGIGPGERIIYFGKNNALFFPVFFGCLRAGVILVPVNWRYSPGELSFILQDASPRLVIYDAAFKDCVSAAARDVAYNGPSLVVHGSGEDPGEGTLAALLEETRVPTARPSLDPDACALLMYTSGTTGKPKGVMLSHRALALSRWVEIGSPHWADWTGDDVLLSAMPNFHIGGLSWMLIGLLRSLTCVLTDDPSPANLLRLCHDYSVTRTFMVATVVKAFVELAEHGGIPENLKGIYYGAAPMDPLLLKKSLDVLRCQFSQYFGMTENCGSITFLPADCHNPDQPALLGSVGRVLPGMEISIRDLSGNECPLGQHGEIWVKAPTLMLGYWNRPDATAEVMTDGWYRSGDGGYLDENGFLYLTDRLKDMIVSGGENIYPGEVEAMLRDHPAIKEVVVVGMPDPVWGEAVCAVVEWKDGMEATLDDLRAFGRNKLAGFKLPKILRVVEQLPRTATGKLQRGVARKRMVVE